MGTRSEELQLEICGVQLQGRAVPGGCCMLLGAGVLSCTAAASRFLRGTAGLKEGDNTGRNF